MPTNLSLKTVLPWLAALAVVLLAWLTPLPDAVLGKDQRVVDHIGDTRSSVSQAQATFTDAQKNYLAYVGSINMQDLLTQVRAQLAQMKQTGTEAPALSGVATYAPLLQTYAQAGETYYNSLKQYDDDLMAWSRSLGALTESLRKATFPIADHLRLYPPPIGDTPDPPYMTAAQATIMLSGFTSDYQKLQRATAPADKQKLAAALDQDVTNVWDTGRSIERIESLHTPYSNYLKTYDGQVQVTATQTPGVSNISPLALILDILVALIALAGVGMLFVSGWARERREASV